MTKAEERILKDVTENGPQKFTGHMEKPIKALAAKGLVTVDADLRLCAHGRGSRTRWVYTVAAISR